VIDARLDWRTVLFMTAVALLTALLFGLVPAFRTTRVDLTPALKDGSSGAGRAGGRLHTSRFLVAGQVALSTLLLAGAGLFVRTLVNLSVYGRIPRPARRILGARLAGRIEPHFPGPGWLASILIGYFSRVPGRIFDRCVPCARVPGGCSGSVVILAFSDRNRGVLDPMESGTGAPDSARDLHYESAALTAELRALRGQLMSSLALPRERRSLTWLSAFS
jgi:hypothetical protein